MGILQSIRAKFIGTLSDDYKLLCDAIMHEVAVEASWANVKGCPIVHAAELAHTNNQGPKPWANKHAYLISCNGLPLTRVQWIELLDCTDDDITENNVVLLTTTMVGELVSAVYEGDDADIIIEIQEEIPEFLNNSAIAQADLSDSPIAILDYAFKAQQDKEFTDQDANKSLLLCIAHYLDSAGIHIDGLTSSSDKFKVFKNGQGVYYITVDDSVSEGRIEKLFWHKNNPGNFTYMNLYENVKKLPVVDGLSGTSTGGVPAHVTFAALANSLIPTSAITFNLPGMDIDCKAVIVSTEVSLQQLFSTPNDLVQYLVERADEYIGALGSDSIYFKNTTGFTYVNTKRAVSFHFGVSVANISYFTDAVLEALDGDGTYETVSINGALPSNPVGIFNVAIQSSGNKYLYLTAASDIDLSLAANTYLARLTTLAYSLWSGVSLATINADGIYIFKTSETPTWEIMRLKSDYIGSTVSVSQYTSSIIKIMKAKVAPTTYSGTLYISKDDYSSSAYNYYLCTKEDIGETVAQFNDIWMVKYVDTVMQQYYMMLVDLESPDDGHGVTYNNTSTEHGTHVYSHIKLTKTVQELRNCFKPIAEFVSGNSKYYIYDKYFVAYKHLLEIPNDTGAFQGNASHDDAAVKFWFKIYSERNDACSDSTIGNSSAAYGSVGYSTMYAQGVGESSNASRGLQFINSGANQTIRVNPNWEVIWNDGNVAHWWLVKNSKLYCIPAPYPRNVNNIDLVGSAWHWYFPYKATGTWSYTGTGRKFNINSINNEACMLVLGPQSYSSTSGWGWISGSSVNTVYITAEVLLTPVSGYSGPMLGSKPMFARGDVNSYAVAEGPIELEMQDCDGSTVYISNGGTVYIDSSATDKIITTGKYKIPLDYEEVEGVPGDPTGIVQSHNKNVVEIHEYPAWQAKWGYTPKWLQDYGTQNKTDLPIIVGLSDEVNKQIRDKIRPAIWLKRVVTSITHSYLGQYPILNYIGEQPGYMHPYAWSDGTVTRYTMMRNPKVGDTCYTYKNSNNNSYTIGKVWETYV